MPDDKALDYLPTQAIADFLSADVKVSIDGVLYPSVERGEGKVNIVLFRKSSRVKPLEILKGTSLSVMIGTEEDRIDYAVFELVSSPPPSFSKDSPEFYSNWSPFDSELLYDEDRDLRKFTLQLDKNFVEVHHIKGVRIATDRYPVRRMRLER